MNAKDFIVLPWGKPGNSVKLKYKNSQELKTEKLRLELDNHDMEKKLQEFQATRSREKQERQSSGYHWKSGQVGKLGNQSHMISQNKGNAVKFSSGKMKLKLLKEQLQEPIRQLHYTRTNTSESENSGVRGKACGQCEDRAALMVCLECGEDYCSGCFAKIHQKGALRLHRTSLLQGKSHLVSSVLGVAHQLIKEANPDGDKEHHFTKAITDNHHEPESGLLRGRGSDVEVPTAADAECKTWSRSLPCTESFDEEASAQSFQEALQHWRAGQRGSGGKPGLPGTKSESQEVCEVQTDLKIWREPLKIEFKEDGLSYMEKLWLKRHRRTPQEELWSMIPGTFLRPRETTSDCQSCHDGSDEGSDVDREKMQHQASFLPAEEMNIALSKPALKILELNDTSEEFEETGNIVPYKVELADTDCHQSHAFHDCKNTLQYENGILHRLIYSKGKADLFHLPLRNRFFYCKDNPKGTSAKNPKNIMYPDAHSPAIENIEENGLSGRDFEGNCKNVEAPQNSADSHRTHEKKNTLPTNTSIRKKSPEDIEASLALRNVHEKPEFEASKTTGSSLLLKNISSRSKSVTRHQGCEIFNFDNHERRNFLPSHGLECSSPGTRITNAGDRKWIPDLSISTCADSVIAVDIFQGAENLLSRRSQKKTDLLENLHSPTSEDSSIFNNSSLNTVKRPQDVPKTSYSQSLCEVELRTPELFPQ